MNQLTLRGFEPELSDFIRKMAAQEGISLNQMAIKLLRKGAGIGSKNNTAKCVNDGLDNFIGSWSSEESKQFDKTVSQLRGIDDEIWK